MKSVFVQVAKIKLRMTVFPMFPKATEVLIDHLLEMSSLVRISN